MRLSLILIPLITGILCFQVEGGDCEHGADCNCLCHAIKTANQILCIQCQELQILNFIGSENQQNPAVLQLIEQQGTLQHELQQQFSQQLQHPPPPPPDQMLTLQTIVFMHICQQIKINELWYHPN